MIEDYHTGSSKETFPHGWCTDGLPRSEGPSSHEVYRWPLSCSGSVMMTIAQGDAMCHHLSQVQAWDHCDAHQGCCICLACMWESCERPSQSRIRYPARQSANTCSGGTGDKVTVQQANLTQVQCVVTYGKVEWVAIRTGRVFKNCLVWIVETSGPDSVDINTRLGIGGTNNRCCTTLGHIGDSKSFSLRAPQSRFVKRECKKELLWLALYFGW